MSSPSATPATAADSTPPHPACAWLDRLLAELGLQADRPPQEPERWQALLARIGQAYEALATHAHRTAEPALDAAWQDTVRDAAPADAAQASSACWSWQPGDEALRISPALARLLSLPAERTDLPLTVWLACLDDSDRELQCEYLMQAAQRSARFSGQLRYTPAQGSEQRWLHYELHSEGDGEAGLLHCEVLDITPRMRRDAAEARSDDQDALTGLASRARFFDLIATARARAAQQGSQLGLLRLGVDGLREVNESHGHEVGDRLLRGVARRLAGSVRLGDQIGRLAGDEFLLLVDPVDSVQHLEAIAYKVQAAVGVPMDLGGISLGVSLSVGIALHPQDAASTLDLVRAAGRALQAAKERGRGRCVLHEQLPPLRHPLAQAVRAGRQAREAALQG